MRWRVRETVGGVLGLGNLFGAHDLTAKATAYATCKITSAVSQAAQMHVCTDDDGIVWLNGEEVYRFEGERGCIRDKDMVIVTLPAGPSTILVKDYNRSGQWAFFMRFTDPDGRALEGLSFSPVSEK